MDYITIPVEFFQVEGLTYSEMIVLAIYKFGTEGRYKKCTYSNQEIADIINMSRRGLIDIKNHLKELGLIEVGKGKEVTYLGISNMKKGEAQFTSGSEAQFTSGSEAQFTGGCSTVHSKGEAQFTPKVKHSSLINVNKEKEEKEDKKRGQQSPSTENFYKVLEGIPGMTVDKESFLRKNIPSTIKEINSKTCLDRVILNDYIIKINNYLKTNYDNPYV